MIRKRLLSIALSLVLVFGSSTMLPEDLFAQSTGVSASAEGLATLGKCGENVSWSLKNGVLTISGTGKMTDYDYEGDSPFYNREDIKSVVIKSGVTSIGGSAFLGCVNLTSITIPSSVKSIGDDAFSYSSNLSSITIPTSVTSIGKRAFEGCEKLISITIPNSVTSIGDSAFEGCEKLISITIPNSVTSIGDYAFRGCENLTSITIPSSVKSIGDEAFSYCTSLTSVTIPNSVTSIGNRAFLGCTNLSSVTIPSSVTSIGGDAFRVTKWLENQQKKNPLVIVNGILIDGKKCSGKVTIPSSVKRINDYAFESCGNLTSVTIPKSVKSIGDEAFSECRNLSSITIPNSVKNIGDSAFDGCRSLKSITIPNSVTSIGDGAFYNCTNLTSITIPNSVKNIGHMAFYGCTSLNSVTIQKGVTSIGDLAFNDCKITSITIPKSVTNIGKEALGYTYGVKVNGFTISGYKDTAGEQYAKDNKFDYELLDIEHVEAKNATCTTNGNKEYWICDGKYYSDKFATKQITKESTVIKATAHKVTNWTTKSFNVDKGTSIQTGKCTLCGKIQTRTVKNAVVRYAGANRYDTAALLSKASHKTTSDTVIIADAMTFQDALIAVPLAKAYNAPLLLANPNIVTKQTEAELARLKAKKVIIVNTSKALKKGTLDALKKKYTTQIINGNNCFETSKRVAEELQKKTKKAPTDVFFTTNKAFADALSISPVAALKGAPILYVDPSKKNLDSNILAYLNKVKGSIKNVYIVGGKVAVPAAIENSIKKALPKKNVKRFDGAQRYETCVMINKYFAKDLSSKTVCIAKGLDFPDALAGGVFAANQKAPLLLADSALRDAQKSFLKDKKPNKLYIFGGKVAVPDKLDPLPVKTYNDKKGLLWYNRNHRRFCYGKKLQTHTAV